MLIGLLVLMATVEKPAVQFPFALEVLEAKWPEIPANVTFWVGFRNVTPESQYICVPYVNHWWTSSGAGGSGEIRGQSHSCETPTEFHLLLPGEAWRVLKAVPPPPGHQGTVTFSAPVVFRRGSQPNSFEATTVEGEHRWSGKRQTLGAAQR